MVRGVIVKRRMRRKFVRMNYLKCCFFRNVVGDPLASKETLDLWDLLDRKDRKAVRDPLALLDRKAYRVSKVI